jgi:hypothetical protein
MNEPLAHFRSVCLDAFSFLTLDHGFTETGTGPETTNPYVVHFTNGEIALSVIGEGWGTTARIVYTGPDGRTVPGALLDPGWEPNPRRRRPKSAHNPELSQDDQIRAAAAVIRDRDHAILLRDYAQLISGADRLARVMRQYE